jgi:glycosyltransferase involved in cell wall biosynthesis
MAGISMITTYPSPEMGVGGVANYARALVGAQRAANGRSYEVLAQQEPRPIVGEARPTWRRGQSALRDVRAALEVVEPEVVHIQHEPFLYGAGLGLLVGFRLPATAASSSSSIVVTLHGVPFPALLRGGTGKTTILRPLARAYLAAIARLRTVDRFLVHEDEQAEALVDVGGLNEERVTVIPHGVDADAQPAPPPSGPLTIGTFGFITPYKDPGFVLDEFAIFRREQPEARLLFSIARHPTRRGRRSYEALRDRAARADGVELFDYVPDEEMASFIRRCHLIVAPHRFAVSASGVAIQAIAHGVPALVLEGSGSLAREGWSFSYSPGGLVEALHGCANKLPAMRSRAVEIREERSWARTASRHRELFEELKR